MIKEYSRTEIKKWQTETENRVPQVQWVRKKDKE